MVDILFVVGVAVAVFVGFNIGGSSTGVAFGPAVGSNTVGKVAAAALMTGFFLLGGATTGRKVIDTMGDRLIEQSLFTLESAVVVLFFIGGALLISNVFGVPASTSMTAVGAIAGLGAARGGLHAAVLGGIVTWWLVAPLLAFWVCAVVGRYLYPYLDARFAIDQTEGPLFARRSFGSLAVPLPVPAPGTSPRELVGSGLVLAIGCYMAFSAGASNTANAVAPLVGSGDLTPNAGILIAGGAVGLGAFTIARRTLDTVGNDLTDLPLLAALIVEVVSASIIYVLSALGIPASLAVSATMCIVGLGWGRATRTVTVRDAVSGSGEARVSVDALTADGESDVPRIGEEDPSELTAGDLFNPGATARVMGLWVLTPSLSAAASYLVFVLLPVST